MKLIKKILFIPINIIGIFSQEKSFKNNLVIGNKILNILGLHVFRVLLASLIFNFKIKILSFGISKEDQKQFREQGFILKENFLSEKDFSKVENEIRNWSGEGRECIQGDSITKRVFLIKETKSNFKYLDKLFKNKYYIKLLKFSSGRNEFPRAYIEQVCHHISGKTNKDPQKNPHSDTFHPTMKSWFFLDDVDENNGPFTYVPTSNRVTFKRLLWEYKKSIKASKMQDGYTEKGSFRFSKEDLEYLGYPKPKEFKVKKNSLVIANTRGIHFRGDANSEKATRLAIWASNRTNPFNPWIGIDSEYFRDLRDKIYQKYYEYLDKKAEKQGRKSSWDKTEIKKF